MVPREVIACTLPDCGTNNFSRRLEPPTMPGAVGVNARWE